MSIFKVSGIFSFQYFSFIIVYFLPIWRDRFYTITQKSGYYDQISINYERMFVLAPFIILIKNVWRTTMACNQSMPQFVMMNFVDMRHCYEMYRKIKALILFIRRSMTTINDAIWQSCKISDGRDARFFHSGGMTENVT